MKSICCRNCNWVQHGFWDKDHNPLSRIVEDGLSEVLLSKEWIVVSSDWLRASDIPFKAVRVFRSLRQRDDTEPTVINQPESALIEGERYEVEPRAYVACELRRRAKDIENMHWRTEKEWKEDNDEGKANCPQCGTENLTCIS
jgi:hypothetical protein